MTSWAYGVTTVPQRLGDLLPRTLGSLLRGGFPQPRLFVDDCEDASPYRKFDLPITTRYPCIRTYGNWSLGMHELYYREPKADYYAIFQDDIVVCQNLREYLERAEMPSDGYLNLYTTFENENVAKGLNITKGWFPSNQQGRGALALVFPRKTMLTLISNRMWIERPLDDKRGHRSIDGGIVHSLSTRYYGEGTEYCHIPSLVQHLGEKSTMGNGFRRVSEVFPGEEFDALSLLVSATITEEAALEKPAIMESSDPLPSMPLGSVYALESVVNEALELAGIPRERVLKWLGRACRGCPEGQRRLNQLGWLSKKAMAGGLDEVKARFEEILDQ